jgi:hypothetical protein
MRLYMTQQEIHNNTINLSTDLLRRVEKQQFQFFCSFFYWKENIQQIVRLI